MTPTAQEGPERLTDGSTFYWSRVFPTLWTTLIGGVMVLAWLDLLGDAPAPLAVKVGITAAWTLASTIFFHWFGSFKDVWLDGDTLLVGDPRRGVRVGLRDVRAVKESRFVQIKTVTLKLGRSTPLGDSITFVPKGIRTFMLPFAASPVARRLEERRRRLLLPG